MSDPTPLLEAEPVRLPPGAERREAVRYPCALDTSFHLALRGRSESWPAVIHNLSARGAALLARRRFEPGALLAFPLKREGDGPDPTLFARVVHATGRPGGGWLLGCSLVGELGEDELRAVCAERVAAPEGDGRAWVRFRCGLETAAVVVGGPPLSCPVTVLDTSPGGLGLLAPCPLEEGTLLNVVLPGPDGQAPWSTLVRVLRVRKGLGEAWQLGCAFASDLRPGELTTLL